MSGDVIIIGNPTDDDDGNNSGSAYVYRRITGVWTLEQKLLASDGTGNDHFGGAVSVSGDVAIVGAWGDYTDLVQFTGSAYVFRYNESTQTWDEEQKLILPDPVPYQFFGGSVSIDGDMAVVANNRDLGSSGATYVYRHDAGGWTLEQKLKASDAVTDDLLGSSVWLSGGVGIFGAPGDDDNGSESGSAYLFQSGTGGWSEGEKLSASDGEAGDMFGLFVSMSGRTVIAGAPYDDDACPGDPACDSGAAYVYTLDTVCVDVDECELGTDDCDSNATCTNTEGSYDCTCNAGYEGDGVTCTLIVPEAPMATGEQARTNRYLRFTASPPRNGVTDEVIRVRIVALDGFSEPETDTFYLGLPFEAPEENSSQPELTFVAAPLQCDSYGHNWASEGVISAFGVEIMPNSTYEVQRAADFCPDLLTNEACWSPPLTITTAAYGDIAPDYAGDPNAAVQPDFNDIAAMVQKFLADPGAPIKAVCQLQPNVVFPGRPVDFHDISFDVSAFLGEPYPFSGPCTCPSVVSCGALSCTSDSTCGEGFCINGFCTDACARCAP